MPNYRISPVARRDIHYNPFFGPQSLTAPRFSSPLFRSLEDDFAQFDNFFREVEQQVAKVTSQTPSFQPRFDIKEESDKFVLHGELPGLQAENLSIEFVDKATMVVSGKVVRQDERGTPPAQQQQIEGKQDTTMSGALPESNGNNYHKASVEDENASTTTDVNTPAPSTAGDNNTVATTSQQQQVTKTAEQPESHYWISERSIGEFSRAFRFPGLVNQDAVKANLKDGILTVEVPKAQEQDHRRKIEVQQGA